MIQYRCLHSRMKLFAGISLAALIAACGSPESPSADLPAASLVVTTVAPVSRELDRSISVSGSVSAWQEMSLGVELTGIRATEVLVEVGDRVRAGQPLLKLDNRTLEVQFRQDDAGVTQAQAALELARANAVRGDSLVEQGLISSSDSDKLRADLRSAEAQLITAQADRDAARLRLGFATLSAPDDGIISARLVQPGQVVSAGSELLRLIRRGRIEWRADLAEADLIRVTPGTIVELDGPAGTVIRGQVRAVSPAVDPATRTGLLYADLPEPGPLRAGMFAEGRILIGKAAASVVPRESVVFRDGFAYLFVLKPLDGAETGNALRRVEQRRVAIGSRQGEVTEILSGLEPGERVVRRGAGFLGNGDVVREVSDSADGATGTPQ
ncbi:MAG: efflux RND transporter periplasmic adaptor subunit [Chromatiales bacterium]|jgi:RND family efflux transporter MFP subunit|nr:efflux RND transporter periplasmic adaptor subunit [Chromatiales bacterium]